MIALIDNYDSFTYNLAQYLGELGAEVRVFRNDQISVDEVAALICWLASEECSFSTGATYDISGGRATY